MHMFAAVVTPEKVTRDTAEEVVADLMAPYNEDTSDDGWWDWWQIGGRYSGVWGEYRPELDPANIVRCDLCAGTGTRPGMDCSRSGGCNGCSGKGMHVAWPTQFVSYEGDVVSLGFVLRSLNMDGFQWPYRVVTPAGTVAREYYVPDAPAGEHFPETPGYRELVRTMLQEVGHGSVVVVDYHS